MRKEEYDVIRREKGMIDRENNPTRIYVRRALSGYVKLTGGKIFPGILSEIAKEVGVTRERVRQIAKAEGYLMPHQVTNKHISVCRICGKKFEGRTVAKYCSTKCYEIKKASYWTKKPCAQCGKIFTFRTSLTRIGREPQFCSKSCYGSHWGSMTKMGGRRAWYWRDRETVEKFVPKGWFTVKEWVMSSEHGSGHVRLIIEILLNRGMLEKQPLLDPRKRGRSYIYKLKEEKHDTEL